MAGSKVARRRRRIDVVNADRHVPTTYEGVLEPNYYCRHWNAKRQKYCRSRAGSGTDHVGTGRCKFGKGNAPVKHGLRRRYEPVQTEAIRELIARFEDDPDPLNMLPELATLRALFVDWINRYQEWRDALLAWYALMARRRDDEVVGRGGVTIGAVVGRVLAEAAPRQVLDISDGYRLLAEVSKVIERIERIAAENAITRKDLNRVMTEQIRVLRGEIRDDDVVQRVIDGWYRIRV